MNRIETACEQLSNGIEPPYRLVDQEQIDLAMKEHLLGLGDAAYKNMLRFAAINKIVIPAALKAAAPVAVKSFHIVLKEKIRECKVSYEEMAGLNPVEKFPLIQAALKLPRIEKNWKSLFAVLDQYPDKVKKRLGFVPPLKASQYFDAIVTLRKYIKQEMLSCARTGRPKHMSLTDFKSLLTTYTIFLPSNEDILEAVRSMADDPHRQTPYQNAMAELLFVRLPRLIAELKAVDEKKVWQKLFSKMDGFGLTIAQKIKLRGCYDDYKKRKDIVAALDRVAALAGKMFMDETLRQRFCGCAISLKQTVEFAHGMYKKLFLKSELDQLQRLHVPGIVLKEHRHYSEVLLEKFTTVLTLSFYPCKDYLDICKAFASRDCTYREGFAEKHLLTPEYFSIRIFKGGKWIGNLYMLDYTRQARVLVLDRVQMPREIGSDFLTFFDCLGQA